MSIFIDVSRFSDVVRHSLHSAKYLMNKEFLKILLSSGLQCKVSRKN